ncbi:LysE family translocator [Gordonia humi]|uniref:LysE family translocator n=1 Tax=Gordonia humi TaxID=686429 RepID=UPI003619486D
MPGDATADDAQRSWLAQAGRGFGVSALNPKVLLLFVALLPQFTSPTSSWPVGVQILLLGGVHVATTAVVYFTVARGAGRLLTGRPRLARAVGRASGAIMMAVAVVLIAEQILSR